MPLINCEINILLTWSEKCIIVTGNVDNQGPKFAITDTKIYIPVATLSAQDNGKLLQLKKGFQKIINWNKYQSEPTLKTRNRNLSYLVFRELTDLIYNHLKNCYKMIAIDLRK